MTDITPKRPDQTTLDLAVLNGFFRDKHTALFTGCIGAIALLILLGAGGALDGFIFWRKYNPYQQDTTALRVGLVLLSGLLGFGLGWFFSPKAAIARSFVVGVLGGVLLYLTMADHAVLGWSAAYILAWIMFFMGFGYWARAFIGKLSQTPTTLGSAQWADYTHCVNGNVIGGTGIQLGTFTDPDGLCHALTYNGDRHMITIAPTRKEKGVAAIIPNLLTYDGSVLVVDPKGENAMVTAKHRAEELGQDVRVVDPWSITGLASSCINPMDWLVKGDVDIGEKALLLSDAIIVAMGDNEQFWTEEAKALLLGVLLLVALDETYAGRRDLGTVRDLLCSDGEELQDLFKRMLSCPHPVVRSTGARCLQKEEKLLSNVLASVQAQTHFLDSQRVRASMAKSDFSFEDLKSKPTSIYVVLPSDKLNAYARFLRLLIQQALTVNAQNIEIQPEKPVLFILDEMPALGKLTMVETAFGLMAGYHVICWGICQDASQLKRIYGDGWETFISNAGVLQYFGSRDKTTADYFSSLCGVTTVWNFSTAVARAFGVTRGKDVSHSETTTTTDTATGMQRNLAYADELMRMPKSRQLLLIDDLNPILANKQPWFKNPDLKDLGVNLHAKAQGQSDDQENAE